MNTAVSFLPPPTIFTAHGVVTKRTLLVSDAKQHLLRSPDSHPKLQCLFSKAEQMMIYHLSS